MKASKINFVVRMQHWMDSVPGQTFLNYAYSWGASIVILGTLFKLTHMDGADLMLFIGMGTEVLVFFLSAFDRPFDKGEVDRELTDELPTDEEISEKIENKTSASNVAAVGGGSVILGRMGGMPQAGDEAVVAANEGAPISGGTSVSGGTTVIFGSRSSATSDELSDANGAPIDSQAVQTVDNTALSIEAMQTTAEDLEQATKNYAAKLKILTETLDRVEKQSARLTTDSEEMTNLNRTLTGINTVYELQLKSISKQVGSIDQINEQTRHMAEQIEELNAVYSRMIKALTVNMKNAAGNNL